MKAQAAAALIALAAVAATGCALSQRQRQDIAQWQADAAAVGHPEVRFVEILAPDTAAWLGALPFGVGGFYVHRPGLGVSGILCWPLSLTWLPAMASASANDYNYREFQHRIELLLSETRARSAAAAAPATTATVLDRIEELHRQGKITDQERQEMRRRALERVGTP